MTKKWTRKAVLKRVLALVLGLLLTATGSRGSAQAAERGYGDSGAGGGGAAAGEEEQDGGFQRAVDLKRFRNKNFEWDTQELIASGFTALHEENQQILKELKEIRERIGRLEEKETPQKSY